MPLFSDAFKDKLAAMQSTPAQRSVQTYAHGSAARLAEWRKYVGDENILPVVVRPQHGGGSLRASAFDLCTVSGFCAIFLTDNRDGPVVVPCPFAVLETIMVAVYGGELLLSASFLVDALEAANFLNMPEVIKACKGYCEDSIGFSAEWAEAMLDLSWEGEAISALRGLGGVVIRQAAASAFGRSSWEDGRGVSLLSRARARE